MRPLFHPAADDITVEGVLHALSDPARVQLFAIISGASEARTCTAIVGLAEQSMPKSTLSQHFKVLRDAGLVRSERRGVEMLNTSRCPEIEARFPGLLPSILSAFRSQASRQRRTRRAKA